MTLLSRTVIVTPEPAVTSVTQTASNTRLDAGCHIGELKLGMFWSAATSTGCLPTSATLCFPTFGDSLAASWRLRCVSSAATGGHFDGRFADPLTFDPVCLMRRRSIPRNSGFGRFFGTGGGGCAAGDSTVGGLTTELSGAWATDGWSSLATVGDGCFGVSNADDWDCSSACILRFSVSGSGGRPRGRFTPSILTFFACCTPQLQLLKQTTVST